MIIRMAHGGGGVETSRLINDVFMKYFANAVNAPMADAAVVDMPGKLAFTTDSFVVKPLFFPGGDIGRLAVCGTVNDLLTTGAKPLYLSAGFILEEGLGLDDLHAICKSMADAAAEAGVCIVTGDTKVVEGSGGAYINTSGIGAIAAKPVRFEDAEGGDVLLLTGTLGDHHACILSQRMRLDNDIESDVAPLTEIVAALAGAGVPLRGMRDVTRGGLATILSEMAGTTGLAPVIREDSLPVADNVRGFARILGLDPLYMGNEGKILLVVPSAYAETAVAVIRAARYGERATAIGTLERGSRPVLITRLAGKKILPPARGEGLPRIC